MGTKMPPRTKECPVKPVPSRFPKVTVSWRCSGVRGVESCGEEVASIWSPSSSPGISCLTADTESASSKPIRQSKNPTIIVDFKADIVRTGLATSYPTVQTCISKEVVEVGRGIAVESEAGWRDRNWRQRFVVR